MKRLVCLLSLALIAGCSSSKPETIWIGHLVPLSGPDRETGEESVRAMQLVLEKARADGFTVAGRPVGVRHVDSATDKMRAEATRLLAVNGVSALIVGPGAGDVAEVIAAARSHSAPVIVLDEVAEAPDYSGAVLLGSDPTQRGEKLAEVAREQLKFTKIAVVIDKKPGCVRLAEAFMADWRKGKGESRSWNLSTLSDGEGHEAIRAWKPDAILLAVPASLLRDKKRPLALLVTGQAILYGGEDDGDLARGDLLRDERILGLTGVYGVRRDARADAGGQEIVRGADGQTGRATGSAVGVRPGWDSRVAGRDENGQESGGQEDPGVPRGNQGVRDGERVGEPEFGATTPPAVRDPGARREGVIAEIRRFSLCLDRRRFCRLIAGISASL